MSMGRLGVDIVVTRCQDADILKFRQTTDDLIGHVYLIDDQYLGIFGAVEDLLGLGAVIDGQCAKLFQRLPGEVAGVGGISVEYNDVFHRSCIFIGCFFILSFIHSLYRSPQQLSMR